MNRILTLSLAMVMGITAFLTGCASDDDRALLRDMPEGSRIRRDWVHDRVLNEWTRARFVVIP